MLTELDPLRAVADRCGFFTREEARECGYRDRAVAAEVRSGRWVRFRRGFFAFGDSWSMWSDEARHVVRARAVMRSLAGRVALSHVSAALTQGVQTTGVDLARVHVTRLDGAAGRTEGDVVHHEGRCVADDLVEVDGLLAVTPGRAVLEAGSRVPGGPCLAMLDSVLHLGLVTHEQLMSRHAAMQHWPYMQPLQLWVRMADGRSASPGESLGRHLFWTGGLPAPELQYPVHSADGRLIGISDWAWPKHGMLGEFDGRTKYGRELRPGMTAGDVVFAEKQREDALREATGWRMIRLVWADYQRPRVTLERLNRYLRPAA